MTSGDWSDIITAVVVAVLMAAGLILVAVGYSDVVGRPPLVLAALVGASAGWVTGILISPYGPKEESAFGKMGKVVLGFLSGYVVSKLDPSISDAAKGVGEKQLVIGAFALVSFLVAVALTYITRRYWDPKGRGAAA